jgi:hypothetical protein
MEVVRRNILNPSVGLVFVEIIQTVMLEELYLQFGLAPPALRTKSRDNNVKELFMFFCSRLVSPMPFWLETIKITISTPSPIKFVKGFAGFHSEEEEAHLQELPHALKPNEFQVSFVVKYPSNQFFQLCAVFQRLY